MDGALSLSGVLFRGVRNVFADYSTCLEQVRAAALQNESKPSLLARVSRFASMASESVSAELLNLLVYGHPDEWVNFPKAQKKWHRQRQGRALFGSLVAFAKAVGITRVILLIDQLEDFTIEFKRRLQTQQRLRENR